MIEIGAISTREAAAILRKNTTNRDPLNDHFAIAAREGKKVRGVIAIYADGEDCAMATIWTDTGPQIGTLLYGAAWRALKALGYKSVRL
jgi:hypothetical protein